jgi:hypothetical protein
MSVDDQIKKEFDKLIKRIPKEQKKKKFLFLCFGFCQIDILEYKGFRVFNIESDLNTITIMSEDDFARNYMNEDLQEIQIVN